VNYFTQNHYTAGQNESHYGNDCCTPSPEVCHGFREYLSHVKTFLAEMHEEYAQLKDVK
jgi:hypothetical protein